MTVESQWSILAGMKNLIRRNFRRNNVEVAFGDSDNIELISKHIESEVGPIAFVVHEAVSSYVHVDVHVVAPTASRRYYTLVTSGMSERRMNPPAQVEQAARAELMLCLPAELGDVKAHWSVNWLGHVARAPFEYGFWLWWGHSIPNGDPPAPLAPDTHMSGVVLMEPKLFPESFKVLRHASGDSIRFFSMIPVHEDEMQYKIAYGTEKLEELFENKGITELLDERRPSVLNN